MTGTRLQSDAERLYTDCRLCMGTGRDGSSRPCPACSGTGRWEVNR